MLSKFPLALIIGIIGCHSGSSDDETSGPAASGVGGDDTGGNGTGAAAGAGASGEGGAGGVVRVTTVSDYENEPAGFTPIAEYTANSVTAPNVGAWHHASDSWSTVVADSDESAPKSPGGVVKQTYPAGTSGGPFPLFDVGFSLKSEVYLCSWFKLSLPWDYNTSGVNKMFFIGTNASAPLNNEVVFSIIGTNEETAQMRGTPQTPSQTSANMANGYFTANESTPGWSLGAYHKLELVLTKNTGGEPNGTMKWWVDGTLVGFHTDVLYNTSGDGGFDRLNWQHYWGGVVDTKAQTDYIWDDHVYISGKP